MELPLWADAPELSTLTPFFPPEPAGSAIVVCPGGGYGTLAPHEGADFARWLNRHGIAAFVLKYRLGSEGHRHPEMLEDAARAIRMVRAMKERFSKVGVMGSSAGGHLASTVLTHFDAGNPSAADPVERETSRPDFGILCYPVITMGRYTHQGSRTNLLGENPSAESLELLSNEKQVTANTPPCFIWHTLADAAVPVENPLLFAQALRAHGVNFELHIYQTGNHGMGLGKSAVTPDRSHPWADQCLYWLREQGLV